MNKVHIKNYLGVFHKFARWYYCILKCILGTQLSGFQMLLYKKKLSKMPNNSYCLMELRVFVDIVSTTKQ